MGNSREVSLTERQRLLADIAPALFLPSMLLVSAIYSPWQHDDSWMTYPILLGLPLLAIWHLVLLIERRGYRTAFFMYAVLNLLGYCYFGLFCLELVTGDLTWP
jgi:hypothetical protein